MLYKSVVQVGRQGIAKIKCPMLYKSGEWTVTYIAIWPLDK